ncbi:unnamed protein product [Ilex paraguariensis]|uniref:AMP-dependent synthetase/ligase domain-containing protein n=1 Tax=Ilex paraguariensis TaxID=185542 RepID=A0ABC8RIN6_9AQUA
MTEDGSKENKLASCCISHEFYKAAAKSPNKIAVVHAYGGIKIAREFRKFYSNNGNQTTISNVSDDSSFFDEFFASKTLPSHPLVYEGDQCFTYSEILSSVDSLSFRLRRILDGGDDPHLIKSTSGDFPGKQSPHVQIFSSSTSPYPGVEPITTYHNTFTPRIVGIYMAPSLEYIIAVLSVLRCGEAFMPLDPSWPQERVLQVVSSSEADLIIVHENSIDGNFGHQGDKLYWLVDSCRCSFLYISMEDKLQHQVCSSRLLWPCEKKKLRPFCYLMYTSGSTGKPKGVCGTEIGIFRVQHKFEDLNPPQFSTPVSFYRLIVNFLPAYTSAASSTTAWQSPSSSFRGVLHRRT